MRRLPYTERCAVTNKNATASLGVPISLSIVMPVFNEERMVRHAIRSVLEVDYPCPMQLIIVDDGSTDDTPRILASLPPRPAVVLARHLQNRGKGRAIRTALDHVTGSHLVILDADLEYSPRDIPSLLEPVIDRRTDHVFGARVGGVNTRFMSFRFAMGGRMTTFAANLLFDSYLRDLHTCLKLVPVSHLRAMTLAEDGFGFDTELTARLLRAGIRPYEVPVSYNGRTVLDGKKLRWTDGITCLRILMRERLHRDRIPLPPAVVVARPVSVLPAEGRRTAECDPQTLGREPRSDTEILGVISVLPPPAEVMS
jgi:glycosyltransferase involved in cell wall biosynthesis